MQISRFPIREALRYVEKEGLFKQSHLPDNLDGMMTKPHLFKLYCLPYYQKYAETLHAQGKKVGSHTDGNLKPLLSLLAESGLDVCESFLPDPLTECTFEEAWDKFENQNFTSVYRCNVTV